MVRGGRVWGGGRVKAKGKQLLIWKKTAPIYNSFCSNALDGAGGRGQKVADGAWGSRTVALDGSVVRSLLLMLTANLLV